MRRRGGNNSYGGLKAKLTKHAHQRIKEWQEEEESKKRKVIEINKERFYRATERLKVYDPDFNNWYDSPAIPDFIYWSGQEFEDVLKVLRKRLKSVKSEK